MAEENSWPGGFCKQGGRRQSPIDIRTEDVITDFKKDFITNGPLKFVGYQVVLMNGINNGHTIQFSTEGDESMHPTLTGGPLKHSYRLEQLHFHWLSEHAINGAKFPMEIHFVHIRADLKVSEALNRKDGLAIVSVFCNVKSELNEHQLETTEELLQHIPHLMKTGSRHNGVILDLTRLLSPDRRSYFTYLGSLTSPECNEVVVWIVFSKPIYISDDQYRFFSKVGVGRHNFRSLQKLNHHLVYQPPPSFIKTPTAVLMMGDAVKVVKSFFQNVTRFMSNGFSSSDS
ncbi:putative carbonic anhydrase 3 [Leptidea sinapis]|uniref:putative carbonic anhydrase 3 n=1 Tax=Leptidea sinapis TaxID=189913 RepID=UPI0021C40F80|nr:putative carbonic anhydrase 3 [Leptidea sinapis]